MTESVALVQRQRATILSMAEKYGESISKLAPRGMDSAYYVEELRLYLSQPDKDGNPSKLLECDPVSIARGVLRVAQTGLSLGVSCDLLPFGKTAQFNARYTGLIDLSIQAGVKAVNYDVVYDDDLMWEYEKGTQLVLRHKRGPRKGKPIAFYAIAEVRQGCFAFEVMTFEEVEAHKLRYSKQWKKVPLEDCLWYGTKTVFRRLSKVLPKNERFNSALQFDSEGSDNPPDDIPDGEFTVIDEPESAGQAPATNGQKPAPEASAETALDRAKQMVLPGGPNAWSGQGGKPLDSMSSKHLVSIRKWCEKRLDEKGDNEELQLVVDAITLIINDREKEQEKMELAGAAAGASKSSAPTEFDFDNHEELPF